MRRNRCRALGMTAIEVLAATLLASLMLAAVAGILGALARQDRDLRTREEAPQWQRQLVEQMLWDVRNARHYQSGPRGVWLKGFGARDFVTMQPTGQPAIITYTIMEAAGDRWLVRRESHPTDRTNNQARTDIVCRGVARFKFGESLMDQAVDTALAQPTPPDDQFLKLPAQISLRLYATAATNPFLDEILCVQ